MWTPATRGRMAEIEKKTKRYPTDLTDEEWARRDVDAKQVELSEPHAGAPASKYTACWVSAPEIARIRPRARSAASSGLEVRAASISANFAVADGVAAGRAANLRTAASQTWSNRAGCAIQRAALSSPGLVRSGAGTSANNAPASCRALSRRDRAKTTAAVRQPASALTRPSKAFCRTGEW